MEEEHYNIITERIGYRFKNPDLLQQAFIRKSYSEENGGSDNEILEFIGDRALDYAVTRFLCDKYGYFSSECDDYDPDEEFNEYYCQRSEGDLTMLKALMVDTHSLSSRIDDLSISHLLPKTMLLGKGDKKKKVYNEDAVKEDLFEAIIGAVVLDSGWNYETIQDTVEIMLNPESFLNREEDNYVQLIQQWQQKQYGTLPYYSFQDTGHWGGWLYNFRGISNQVTSTADQHICIMTLADDLPQFRGIAKSKREARRIACQLAYNHLKKENLLNTIQDEIDNPNKEDAIGQLEILARRGYFSIPKYKFEESHDVDGNPVWKAVCFIDKKDYSYWATSSSKKEAKKEAAYQMLLDVLEHSQEEE